MPAHTLAHSHRNCNKALFMKGNFCMGTVLKRSGSRMAHLILPERRKKKKRVKVMRKGGWQQGG